MAARRARPGTLHDPHRDATTLPLIPRVVEAGVPVLGICRGFQEMNVAFGGTLWQKRPRSARPSRPSRGHHGRRSMCSTAPAHEVSWRKAACCSAIAGSERIMVNSLHSQGVRTLGAPSRSRRAADDGLIEAFACTMRARFALAVQWHPEWQAMRQPVFTALFGAFGDAARDARRVDVNRCS